LLFVRLIALLAAIAVAICALLWIFTGQRRYLLLGGRIFLVSLPLALVALSLLFFERLLVLL